MNRLSVGHTLRCAVLLATLLSVSAAASLAEVTRIEIVRREPFAAEASFGSAGAYEKIVGRFHGELDPTHPMNAGIVDLGKAPRNSRSRVEYSADFYILKPVDPAHGNGTLLLEVPNRGRILALGLFNNAPISNDPKQVADVGNGFLLREGYTLTWSGWQPGLPSGKGLFGIEVPVATEGAAPIQQLVWDEFVLPPNTTRAALTFQAASVDPAQARLIYRESSSAAPQTVPSGGWEFVNDRTVRLLPPGTAFRSGLVYQFIYRAQNPPVSGIGFAATRDWVSFLRYGVKDVASPLESAGKSPISRAIGQGSSQSGRYLRDFLYRGFNEDEAGRKVFEGLNPHIGAARIFLNYRFAQPDRFAYPGGYGFMFYPDINFPFAYETQTDTVSGKSDGLLARCTARGNCPLVMHTVSSTEYWLSSQSLVTTNVQGTRDSTLPEGVRVYLLAGMQHSAGIGPGTGAINPKGVCALPHNSSLASPAMRALLTSMNRWIRDDAAPPLSRYPRLGDGTLVAGERIEFPAMRTVDWPTSAVARPLVDYGPDFDKGIYSRVLPEIVSRSYPTLVPKVDTDGNELGGIRLPDLAVPTATLTGWALRSKTMPGAGELCMLDGSKIPFAKTKAERMGTGDPRPSLEERYPAHATYVEKVRLVAAALEREGYLLAEDVERYAALAEKATW